MRSLWTPVCCQRSLCRSGSWVPCGSRAVARRSSWARASSGFCSLAWRSRRTESCRPMPWWRSSGELTRHLPSPPPCMGMWRLFAVSSSPTDSRVLGRRSCSPVRMATSCRFLPKAWTHQRSPGPWRLLSSGYPGSTPSPFRGIVRRLSWPRSHRSWRRRWRCGEGRLIPSSRTPPRPRQSGRDWRNYVWLRCRTGPVSSWPWGGTSRSWPTWGH